MLLSVIMERPERNLHSNRPFLTTKYIQLDLEAVRTKTKESGCNECENIYISSSLLCNCPLNFPF